jgi:hypothetical protein
VAFGVEFETYLVAALDFASQWPIKSGNRKLANYPAGITVHISQTCRTNFGTATAEIRGALNF